MSDQNIIDTPENWDASSQGYADKIAPIMMENYVEEFVEHLEVNINTEALEVAAGSGALTATLARHVKSLLATDFSPKMLEQAKLKISKAGLSNVSFALMDGQALELDDNTMDRSVCSFGLMLFPNRHKGFTELNRVTRPGGKVLVSGWAGPDRFEALGLFMAAIQQAFPNLPKPDSPPPVFSLADLDSFKIQMEAAGFQNVNVDYIVRDLTVNNFEELWSMISVGAPPVRFLFDKVGAEGKDKIHDALAESIENRFGSGQITISNTATVGVGTVA
jgi:SAM-dependent methyltransferase